MGPTLFLVFINDLLNDTLSGVGIYTDDTTVYSSINVMVNLKWLRWRLNLSLIYVVLLNVWLFQ